MRKFWRPIKITFYSCLAFFFLLSLAVIGYNIYYVYFDKNNLPSIEPLVRFEEPATGEMFDSNGRVIIQLAKEYRRVTAYEDIPLVVKEAILSAEDQRFFEHDGVDKTAIARSSLNNLLHSAITTSKFWDSNRKINPELVFVQGASTITQQLVRLYFLKEIRSEEKNDKLVVENWETETLAHVPFVGIKNVNKLWRKREEARISIYTEKEFAKRFGSKQRAKQEILARFVSFVYLGNGRYGFDAASEYYFGKRIKQLSSGDVAEAAFLAGLIKMPISSKALIFTNQLSRKDHILDRMAISHYLSTSDAEQIKKIPIDFSPIKTKTEAPSVVSDTLDEIKDYGYNTDQFFEGRFAIYSTTNLSIQEIANQALENGLKEYEKRYPEAKDVVQGSTIILRNSDGAILAEVGGRQVFNSHKIAYTDFNRVKHSLRQPGSAFKPFVYLTALKDGWTLASTILDAPIAVPMGSIKVGNKWVRRPPKWIANYDGKFKGTIRLRQALAESRNAPTVRLARMVKIEEVIKTAHTLGIKTSLQPYITTAIGASDVNLLELANAYRAIASGVLAEPYSVVKLTDRNGETIYQAKNTAKPIDVEDMALEQIREGLRGVVRIPGGTAHALDNTIQHRSPQEDFPIPIFGKTGTTNDFRDALFVGATYGLDGITVAVRIGFDDYRELGDKETGAKTALPVFREIMLNIYSRNLAGPAPQFPEEIEKNIDDYLGKK